MPLKMWSFDYTDYGDLSVGFATWREATDTHTHM